MRLFRVLTSIGSDYFPQSAEGWLQCFIIALYGFAVFGYVTATLATYFVGRDTEAKDSEIGRRRRRKDSKI
ncbi:MAG: hypothetical protein H0X08_04045 [Blastocatellia bacterium]|nr:hypothetical protein [Blastocatellia bacterium]